MGLKATKPTRPRGWLVGLSLAMLLFLWVAAAPRGHHSSVQAAMSTIPANGTPQQPGHHVLDFIGKFYGNPATCNMTQLYVPSTLEQMWLDHVTEWQGAFCGAPATLDNYTQVWLSTLGRLQQEPAEPLRSPAQVLAGQSQMDARVFSQFITTYNCGYGTQKEVTWIEPLSHGLRHPNALCKRGADVMDRGYLLLAHNSEVQQSRKLSNAACAGRRCQALFFDLGASLLQPTPREAGQGWFYDAYRRQGITFDRFMLWEARVQPPADIYKHVPKADMHKYQYFNIPASADMSDESSPVNMLKRIAQPGDFVVFKLDIDHAPTEDAIMKSILSDPATVALIDEFYFEQHVNFTEMTPYWRDQIGPGTSLATSYADFTKLRRAGIRAHSWV